MRPVRDGDKFMYDGDELEVLSAEDLAKLPPPRRLPIPAGSAAGIALREGAKRITRRPPATSDTGRDQ